jgi:hypothetical protein
MKNEPKLGAGALGLFVISRAVTIAKFATVYSTWTANTPDIAKEDQLP